MQAAFTMLFSAIGLALLTMIVFWLTKLLACRSRTEKPDHPSIPPCEEDVKVWKNPEGL